MRNGGGARGAIGLLAVVAAGGVLAWLVLNSPIFAVRHIRVLGNVSLTTGDVLQVAGVEEGENLFRVSVEDVERSLLRNPWISGVTVERRWPSTLTLQVTERTPRAVVEDRRGVVLVAGDATVLDRLPRQRPADPMGAASTNLPSLARTEEVLRPGDPYPGPSPLVRVAASFPPQLRRAVRRVRIDDGDIVLELRAGGSVLYGDAGATGAKNTALLAVLDEAARQGIEVGYIDVRIPSSPTLKPAG